MIPSYRWFPSSLAERVLWFANFTAQFALVADLLGLTDKVQQVNDDNLVMQFIGQADTSIEAYHEGIRQYRRIITEDAPGTATPDFPDNPMLALPKVVATGIFTRTDKLRDQIMNADKYTNEIGGLLDILVKKTDSISPEDKVLTLKGQAMPAQQIQVEFVRGDSDGITLQMRVDGGEWVNAGNFYKSPVVINVPGDASKAHEVELRGRYLEFNTPVGQNSATIMLVSQP